MPIVPRLWSPRRIVAAAAAAIAVAVALLGRAVDTGTGPRDSVALTAAIAVSFTVMGVLVLIGAPGHRVGRLMTAAGLIAAIAVLAASWRVALPLAWLSKWSWWPPLGLIFLALLVFPDGRLPSRRWRVLAVLLGIATATATMALALAAVDHPRTLLTIGVELTPRAHVLIVLAQAAIVVAGACLVPVLASLWLRWRRADGQTRQQLACLWPAGLLLVLGLVLDALGLPDGWMLSAVALPLGMSVAVLRYRLYDLDQILNRTIVWLVMTLLVVVGFVGIVALLRDALMRGRTADASLVATGLIAVAFEPLRRRVQLGVNRLLYGERDDPYKVIGRLGDLLGHTVEPGAVLPLLTGTISRSLQVPYVAVELEGRDGPRLFAEHGRSPTSADSFEMVAHGERVGRLIVATRSAGSRFTGRERKLLQDIALHAAVAAEATRLTRDLQDSRERLIMAREEERRRLRRDLHDGLGPSLAGMSMQVHAARKLLAGAGRVTEILDAIAADLQSCTFEVRQLVDQLRPPALDAGLEAALIGECDRFNSAGLSIELVVEGNLADLPAAVEMAVYRIVAEALTNVARHSRAHACQVSVRRRQLLLVEIVDDGIGIPWDRIRPGVGLASIRERATELGGDCTIGPADPRGTSIHVRLPFTLAATPHDLLNSRAGVAVD